MRSIFGVRTMGCPYALRQVFRSSDAMNRTLRFGGAARRTGMVAAAPETRKDLRVRDIAPQNSIRLRSKLSAISYQLSAISSSLVAFEYAYRVALLDPVFFEDHVLHGSAMVRVGHV